MTRLAFLLVALTLLAPQTALAQSTSVNFFITSTGPGDGAALGGLSGADQHCQDLASAAGAGDLTWHAYLSTTATDAMPAVNARDRIGEGPWFNFAGIQIAANVNDLHSDTNNLTKETILSEKGEMTNGRGDSPNMHDILTGSQLDGTTFPGEEDTTCSNWTSNDEGSVRVGHGDRYSFTTPGSPWNSSHGTPGCSQENLVSVGGGGLLYCFAID